MLFRSTQIGLSSSSYLSSCFLLFFVSVPPPRSFLPSLPILKMTVWSDFGELRAASANSSRGLPLFRPAHNLPALPKKSEEQSTNPITLCRSLSWLQWGFFMSGWLAWCCDAIE